MFKILLFYVIFNQYEIPPIEVSAKYPESFLSTKGTSYLVDSAFISAFKFDPSLFNFSYVPSVNINSYGYPGYLQTGFLRGFSSGRTGVYIEGFKLNSRTQGTVNLSYISGLPLSRVEVLSSSGSSIYGESALSGVINFKLPRKLGFNLKGGAGNLRTTIFSGIAGFPFSYFYYSNYTSIPPEKNKDSHLPRFVNIFENENIRSIFFYSKNNIGSPTSETDREDDEIILIGAMYKNKNINLGYQYKKETIDFISEAFPSKTSNVSNRSFGALFLDLDALRFKAGFEYEKEYLKGTYFEDIKPKDERFYPYFSLDLILEKVIPYFEGGKELKGAFKTESPFVYRTGVLIFSEGGSLYFNYSKGFKAPTLLDLYFPETQFAKGNPDLKSESSKEIEGGLKVIEGKSYLLFSYFKRELKDGILWVVENFLWTPHNLEKVKISGFEGILNVHFEKIILNTNFIIYKERKSEEGGSVKDLLLVPTYNFSFMLGYKQKGFSSYYRMRVLGPHLSIDPTTYPQKIEEVKHIVFHDVSFGLRLSSFLELSLIVTNLDNKHYEYQIGYPLERRRVYVFAEAGF